MGKFVFKQNNLQIFSTRLPSLRSWHFKNSFQKNLNIFIIIASVTDIIRKDTNVVMNKMFCDSSTCTDMREKFNEGFIM